MRDGCTGPGFWTVSRPHHTAAHIFARTYRGVRWPSRSTAISWLSRSMNAAIFARRARDRRSGAASGTAPSTSHEALDHPVALRLADERRRGGNTRHRSSTPNAWAVYYGPQSLRYVARAQGPAKPAERVRTPWSIGSRAATDRPASSPSTPRLVRTVIDGPKNQRQPSHAVRRARPSVPQSASDGPSSCARDGPDSPCGWPERLGASGRRTRMTASATLSTSTPCSQPHAQPCDALHCRTGWRRHRADQGDDVGVALRGLGSPLRTSRVPFPAAVACTLDRDTPAAAPHDAEWIRFPVAGLWRRLPFRAASPGRPRTPFFRARCSASSRRVVISPIFACGRRTSRASGSRPWRFSPSGLLQERTAAASSSSSRRDLTLAGDLVDGLTPDEPEHDLHLRCALHHSGRSSAR